MKNILSKEVYIFDLKLKKYVCHSNIKLHISMFKIWRFYLKVKVFLNSFNFNLNMHYKSNCEF